jgi:hypothetical protein
MSAKEQQGWSIGVGESGMRRDPLSGLTGKVQCRDQYELGRKTRGKRK